MILSWHSISHGALQKCYNAFLISMFFCFIWKNLFLTHKFYCLYYLRWICNTFVIIHSKNIYDMYNVNSKSMKIKDPHNSFGIFIRIPVQKLPIVVHSTVGCAEYYIDCTGRKLAYDRGKGIKSKKDDSLVVTPHQSATTPTEVPNSVAWSATHPFQGGSFTPK